MDSSDIKNNGVFCMHPWVTQIKNPLGDVRLCPVKNNFNAEIKDMRKAWNSPSITKIRENMMNGRTTEDICGACYTLEQHNIPSERLKSLENVSNEKIIELLSHTTENGVLDIDPEYVELSLDIECQSMCVQCNRQSSSTWKNNTDSLVEMATHRVIKADFRTRYGYDDDMYKWSDEGEKFWPTFWEVIPNVKHLFISGGEPFESTKAVKLITDLSEKEYSNELRLTINTGGNYIPDNMWEIFNKFKKTTLLFSVDAVKERAEWLRHPLKWENFERNVKKADENNTYIEFTTNIHSLNLAYVPEIYEWIWSMNLKNVAHYPINYTFNHRPSYLDVRFVEQETKQFINQKLWDFFGQHNTKFDENYFGSMMGCLDYMWQHKDNRKNYLVKEFVTTMDNTRDTKFEDIFPELHECL